MKIKDEIKALRGLSAGDLHERLRSTEEELMNLRFRQAAGQLEYTAQLTLLRRRVARVRTILNQTARVQERAA